MTPYQRMRIAQAKINSASTDKQLNDARREFDRALKLRIKENEKQNRQ